MTMRSSLGVLLTALVLAGCGPNPASRQTPPPLHEPNLAAIPSGDIAGSARSTAAANIANPFEGQPAALVEGKRLYVQMNCAGCHGYDLGGSMGPNLKDKYWRYGGSPAAIYRSIANGHPQGMPAWNRALPPNQIWQLTAYIQSFGGATSPADYQGALEGDSAAKSTSAGGGTGAQSGEKGGTAASGQPANP
jgi:cytochrome c oxidase cbb3-type subunit 3